MNDAVSCLRVEKRSVSCCRRHRQKVLLLRLRELSFEDGTFTNTSYQLRSVRKLSLKACRHAHTWFTKVWTVFTGRGGHQWPSSSLAYHSTFHRFPEWMEELEIRERTILTCEFCVDFAPFPAIDCCAL
ncbi:Hypothetical protein, putative [Bodo saltans]|uniref:Uncharacterized protein n=1 Tax=Bodo saltans TaxID=75058 RepID=A0A0S4IRV4_BODSA|nr:Hypothetical protein, putative [Bodo saltans]|eukprot:CUF55425.1 Hypothetical protein, putative [Bodo saltans]